MDEKTWLAIFLVVLLLGGLFLSVSYCGAPQRLAGGSGDVAMVCLFPAPWSSVFGEQPTFVVNLFVAAALPLAIFVVVWLWGLISKGS
jgi:hypothetical protein